MVKVSESLYLYLRGGRNIKNAQAEQHLKNIIGAAYHNASFNYNEKEKLWIDFFYHFKSLALKYHQIFGYIPAIFEEEVKAITESKSSMGEKKYEEYSTEYKEESQDDAHTDHLTLIDSPSIIINGRELYKVPGDGNCFFHAIADQLRELGMRNEEGQLYTHDLLRALVTSHVDTIPELRSLFSDQEYRDLSRLNGWVDEGTLRSLANLLKITIHVVRLEEDEIWVDSEGSSLGELREGAEKNPQVHIYYNGLNHYDSLRSRNANEVSSIVNLTVKEFKCIKQISQMFVQLREGEKLLYLSLAKEKQKHTLIQEIEAIMADVSMKGYYSSITSQILALKIASLVVSSGFIDANRSFAGKTFGFLSNVLGHLLPGVSLPVTAINSVSEVLERYGRGNLLKQFDFFGTLLTDVNEFADEIARLLVRAHYHANNTFSKEKAGDDLFKLMTVIIEAEPAFNERPNFSTQMLIEAIFEITPCFDPLPTLESTSSLQMVISNSVDQISLPSPEKKDESISNDSQLKNITQEDFNKLEDKVDNLKKQVAHFLQKNDLTPSNDIDVGRQVLKKKSAYRMQGVDEELSKIKTNIEQLTKDTTLPIEELIRTVSISQEEVKSLQLQIESLQRHFFWKNSQSTSAEFQNFIKESLEKAVEEYKKIVDSESIISTHKGHPVEHYNMLLGIAHEQNIESQLSRLLNYMQEADKTSGMRDKSLVVLFIENLEVSKEKMPDLYEIMESIILIDEEKQQLMSPCTKITKFFPTYSDTSKNYIKLEKWRRAFMEMQKTAATEIQGKPRL